MLTHKLYGNVFLTESTRAMETKFKVRCANTGTMFVETASGELKEVSRDMVKENVA